MDRGIQQQLIDRVGNAVARLDEYEDGPLAIGQVGLAMAELAEVVKVLILLPNKPVEPTGVTH